MQIVGRFTSSLHFLKIFFNFQVIKKSFINFQVIKTNYSRMLPKNKNRQEWKNHGSIFFSREAKEQ